MNGLLKRLTMFALASAWVWTLVPEARAEDTVNGGLITRSQLQMSQVWTRNPWWNQHNYYTPERYKPGTKWPDTWFPWSGKGSEVLWKSISGSVEFDLPIPGILHVIMETETTPEAAVHSWGNPNVLRWNEGAKRWEGPVYLGNRGFSQIRSQGGKTEGTSSGEGTVGGVQMRFPRNTGGHVAPGKYLITVEACASSPVQYDEVRPAQYFKTKHRISVYFAPEGRELPDVKDPLSDLALLGLAEQKPLKWQWEPDGAAGVGKFQGFKGYITTWAAGEHVLRAKSDFPAYERVAIVSFPRDDPLYVTRALMNEASKRNFAFRHEEYVKSVNAWSAEEAFNAERIETVAWVGEQSNWLLGFIPGVNVITGTSLDALYAYTGARNQALSEGLSSEKAHRAGLSAAMLNLAENLSFEAVKKRFGPLDECVEGLFGADKQMTDRYFLDKKVNRLVIDGQNEVSGFRKRKVNYITYDNPYPHVHRGDRRPKK